MKKYIKVMLTTNDSKYLHVDIDAENGLHELEIYCILEKMFPVYIFIDYKADPTVFSECYNVIFKNGLSSVSIYRA